jgi:hypothetical protein
MQNFVTKGHGEKWGFDTPGGERAYLATVVVLGIVVFLVGLIVARKLLGF